MARIELVRQKLIGMINRIDSLDELQKLIDQLYVQEQEKIREEKEREKEKIKKGR